MITSVEYLDGADPALESKMSKLEGEKYVLVKRLTTDIDYEHKKEHLKMVRCVVEPPKVFY